MQNFHAVIWKEDSLFVAKALELEVTSQGASEQEALKNLQEALELFFEDRSTWELLPVEQPKIKDLTLNIHA